MIARHGVGPARALALFAIVGWMLGGTGLAQEAPPAAIMKAVRDALAPALPFPVTDDSGTVPANNSTEALWMVRHTGAGERTIEVVANPLNQVNQLRAERAMAQIELNIEAAQRRATAQYETAVAEAKRTGRSQDVDGVTLSDEGIAGAKIDAESHVLIDVYFNEAAYTFTVTSSIEPGPSRQVSIPGATVMAVRSNVYRDDRGAERYAEAETQIFLGGVAAPDVRKGADHTYEVVANAAPADTPWRGAIVVRLRGNEVLMADVVRKTNWGSLLELLK
jgi:hypothetical protein